MDITKDFFDSLEQELPPLVLRSQIYSITGGLVANKTLANADSLGTGPSQRVLCGSRIAYPKKALIEWLHGKIKDVKSV